LPRPAAPLLAVLLLAPGCAVWEAITEPAGIVLPDEEAAQVRGELGMPPEEATDAQILASVRKVLEPLPVSQARFDHETGQILVVLAPLTEEVLDGVTSSFSQVTTGGWIGILVAAVGASGTIVGLAMKKLELMKRAQVAKVAARADA
jgi:hypothetical protein